MAVRARRAPGRRAIAWSAGVAVAMVLASGSASAEAVTPMGGSYESDAAGRSEPEVFFGLRRSVIENHNFRTRGLPCTTTGRPKTTWQAFLGGLGSYRVRHGRLDAAFANGAFSAHDGKFTGMGSLFRVKGRWVDKRTVVGEMRFSVHLGKVNCDSGWVRWAAAVSLPVTASVTVTPGEIVAPGDTTTTVVLRNLGSVASRVTKVFLHLPSYAPPAAETLEPTLVSLTASQGGCDRTARTPKDFSGRHPKAPWENGPYVACSLGVLKGGKQATITAVEHYDASGCPPDPYARAGGGGGVFEFYTPLDGGMMASWTWEQFFADVSCPTPGEPQPGDSSE